MSVKNTVLLPVNRKQRGDDSEKRPEIPDLRAGISRFDGSVITDPAVAEEDDADDEKHLLAILHKLKNAQAEIGMNRTR